MKKWQPSGKLWSGAHVGSTKRVLRSACFPIIFNDWKCHQHPKKPKTCSQSPTTVPTLPQYTSCLLRGTGFGKKASSLNPVLTCSFTDLIYAWCICTFWQAFPGKSEAAMWARLLVPAFASSYLEHSWDNPEGFVKVLPFSIILNEWNGHTQKFHELCRTVVVLNCRTYIATNIMYL